jgi:hypothetical protein
VTSGSVTHSVSGIISQVFLRAFDLVADDTLRGGEPINDPINDPMNDPINSNNEFLPEHTIGRIQGCVDMAEIGRKAKKVGMP